MVFDDVPIPETSPMPPASEIKLSGDFQALVNPLATKPNSTLRDLGRRITSRTTDLLAIAIVLIAGVAMGRQMLQWWHDDPPAVLDMGPLENLGTEWGANSQPVSLEFGNSPLSMTRQVLTSGGPQAALDSVHQQCRAILLAALPPETPVDQAELEQLNFLSKLTPETEQPGNWQLFTVSGGLPMVIGVKTFDAAVENLVTTGPPDGRRVICWGLVFPGLTPDSWTAYTFARRPASIGDSHGTSSPDFDFSQLKLPVDCQRTVLMQESDRGGLLGFQGQGQAVAWQRHFSKWFQSQGWKQDGGWQPLSGGWTGRFVRREPGRTDDSMIQIQCYQQQADQGVGLIQWFPGRTSRQESPPPAAP